MSAITDHFQFVGPFWVILKRIDFAVRKASGGEPAGRLVDLKWHREGTTQNDGTSNLPSLQPTFADVETRIAAGAQKEADKKTANTPVDNSITFRLRLRTDTKHGFVRRDALDEKQKLGHLEWVALILDAIETNELGQADSRLERTIKEPVAFIVREPDFTTLSMESVIEIVMVSNTYNRAERSCTPIPHD